MLLLAISTFVEIAVSPGFSKTIFDMRVSSKNHENSLANSLYLHVLLSLCALIIGLLFFGPNLWLSALAIGSFTSIVSFSIDLHLKHQEWKVVYFYTFIMHAPKLIILVVLLVANFIQSDLSMYIYDCFCVFYVFGILIMVIQNRKSLQNFKIKDHYKNLSIASINLLVIAVVNLQVKIDMLLVSMFYDADMVGLYGKALLMCSLFPIVSRTISNIRLAVDDYGTVIGDTLRRYRSPRFLLVILAFFTTYVLIVWIISVYLYKENIIFYYFAILSIGYIGSIFFNSIESNFYKSGTHHIVFTKLIVIIVTLVGFLILHQSTDIYFPLLFVVGKIAGWIYILNRFNFVSK